MTNAYRVSSGTLTVLGLTNARSIEKATTAHFLLGEHCVHSCKFCSQAKLSGASSKNLSRVTWPKVFWKDLREPLERAMSLEKIERICLQVVESPGATKEAIELLRRIRDVSPAFPISVCVTPSSVSRVGLFFSKGASTVGLPVDAAAKSVYGDVKGDEYERTWSVIERASKKWPGRISTHFVAGLGETEEDIAKSIARSKQLGLTVAMFAFTPVRGTQMQNVQPPPIPVYRRIQLAAYILSNGGCIDDFMFRDGKIVDVRNLSKKLISDIAAGLPFQTSGCPGCNRPYYNERPGKAHMNYPRPLTRVEAEQCLSESGLCLSAALVGRKSSEG